MHLLKLCVCVLSNKKEVRLVDTKQNLAIICTRVSLMATTNEHLSVIIDDLNDPFRHFLALSFVSFRSLCYSVFIDMLEFSRSRTFHESPLLTLSVSTTQGGWRVD